jgi:hypothetical protein
MTQALERMLPLYEAKMIHQFDHRWATYEADGTVRDVTLAEKQDPSFVSLPRYWVREELVRDRLGGRWDRDWLLGWRDICRSTDERTMIATINGEGASPEGGTLLAFPEPPGGAPSLLAIWNSFAFDFVARQKVGGTHLKYFTMRQLPAPAPSQMATPVPWDRAASWDEWLSQRVLELLLDSHDMASLAEDFASNESEHAWDPERRRLIRAELDAAVFNLFGIPRDDVDYIMDTFPIVKRKDEATFGSYRTKELILEVFDVMQAAIDAGAPYRSAADGRHHG